MAARPRRLWVVEVAVLAVSLLAALGEGLGAAALPQTVDHSLAEPGLKVAGLRGAPPAAVAEVAAATSAAAAAVAGAVPPTGAALEVAVEVADPVTLLPRLAMSR
jgi:hypothetical protein